MPVRFEDATAITPLGDNRYEVDLAAEFAVMGTKPNGGYMLTCLAKAALDAAHAAGATHQHVVIAGAQYLSSPDVGKAQIDVDVLRVGRSASQVHARISQNGVVGVDAKFTLATLPDAGEPYWGSYGAPEIAPFDECQPMQSFGDPRNGVGMRMDPSTAIEMTPDGPKVKGEGEYKAWFQSDTPVDTTMLMYAADCLPPATFGVVMTGWVPTLDLTVYVRALPAPGPLKVHFYAQMIQDGFVDEVCEMWDSAGRLVLQCTQLAALRLPPTE